MGAVAGVLLTASLPPFGWWVLGWAGAAVLYVALDGRQWRGRLAVGLGCGVGLYGYGMWWATEFHAVGYVALLVLETLIFAAVVSAVPARGRWPRALAFPAALVLAEALRGSWPFGGLPISGLDLGQVGGPLLGAARVGGHLLVVALVGTAGVALAALLELATRTRHERRVLGASSGGGWQVAGVAGALTVVIALAGVVAPDGQDAGELGVAAVQGGGERGLRAVDSDPRLVFDAHIEASRDVRGPVDLVLWPEDVVDLEHGLDGSAEEAELAAVARALGATLVAGVVEDVGGARFRNAAVAFGAEGDVVDRFDKVHRVPFGEYVPFRSLVESVADLAAVPRDAEAGTGPGILDTPAGRMAVTISYEVFFADRARSGVRAGGRVLLVPTNASSYPTSQVPTQEVAVAQVRAVETGRWVVQAAPTGYSAVIDHRGRVHQRGPLGDRAVLQAVVGQREGLTWAMRLGDQPIVVLAIAILAAAWVVHRKLE